MSVAPEFSRLVLAGGLPARGREVSISANEAECRALARRFAIPAIVSLAASVRLVPRADGRVEACGQLRARVVQVCVVALEPFAQEVLAPLAVTFVPRALVADEAHGGIDAEAADEEAYDGDRFDLGEVVAQSLSLALDPWPRNPDSRVAQAEPGDRAAAPAPGAPALPAGPFAALAKRRH
ncbi:MAG: DUF177 domain-containing protein [Acetobacteraceae bacterium]|nr:DUF177 domain-containing protein [Acetobacteraceae bacterium]